MLERLGKGLHVDARNRDMGDEPEHDQHCQGKQDLRPKIRDTHGLDHGLDEAAAGLRPGSPYPPGTGALLRYLPNASARRLDLLPSRARKSVGGNLYRDGYLAVAEHFDRFLQILDDACL